MPLLKQHSYLTRCVSVSKVFLAKEAEIERKSLFPFITAWRLMIFTFTVDRMRQKKWSLWNRGRERHIPRSFHFLRKDM
jgi:hypothetical protein